LPLVVPKRSDVGTDHPTSRRGTVTAGMASPFFCVTCELACGSQRRLDAHTDGRKHKARAAGKPSRCREISLEEDAQRAAKRPAASRSVLSGAPQLTSWPAEVTAYLKQQYVSGAVGPEEAKSLLATCERTVASLGIPPLDTTVRVNLLKTTRPALVERLQQLGVGAVADSPLYSVVPDLVIIPGSGPNAVTADGLPMVCLDRRCGEAVMTGADVFSPGVKGLDAGIAAQETVAVCVAMAPL
jgi:hypothetical protein